MSAWLSVMNNFYFMVDWHFLEKKSSDSRELFLFF